MTVPVRMASPNSSVGLNAEPSLPDERETRNLQPKSYVEAVQENPAKTAESADRGTDTTDGITGTDSVLHRDKVNGSTADSEEVASILRIAKTDESTINYSETHHSNGDAPKKSGQADQEERPSIERQESKHEYTATGLDEHPRSSPRHKPKTSSSRESNAASSPNAKHENNLVIEKFEDHTNGVKLVSVEPVIRHEKEQERSDSLRSKTDEDNRTLVSGRQAGKRWETSGIRFAPMNVPLQRRLQTLVVLFHSTCIALSISFFFFLCAIPIFWPLLIIYMIYCMSSNAATSGTLKYRSNFLRSLPIWSLFASYFPARLHRSEELPPTRKYIFGYHPHGIISHGAFAAFGTEALGYSQLFPGITNTLLTLDSNFRIPIYRDYALAMGLGSVSRESCENLLSKGGKNNEGMGRAITIVVGGAAESLDAQPYSMRLVLKKRKGFIKMALRTGADLVPVLAFGENDLYDQVTSNSHPSIHKAQLLVKKLLGFTIPLFHARGVFNYDVGLMPYRRPLNIVVGKPIKVAQSTQPQQEEIDRLHEQYVQELESIWISWKDEFAKDRKGELEILE